MREIRYKEANVIMVSDVILSDLLVEFNLFFEGSAEAKISGDRLEITIGSQTMLISLPKVIGAQAKDLS